MEVVSAWLHGPAALSPGKNPSTHRMGPKAVPTFLEKTVPLPLAELKSPTVQPVVILKLQCALDIHKLYRNRDSLVTV
jgi:hypothetical protein